MANWPFAIVLLASSLLWQDRTPAGINTPEFEAERRQANELFLAGKVLDALPLYEHLEKLDPNDAVFAERRAAGLIAKSANLTEKTAQQAVLHEAYSELLRAQALGDNSAYTINQIESMKALFSDAGKSASSENPANAQLLARAEAAFARSDYAAALQSYSAMAANDPKSYQAALFAGDTCFRMHDTAAAAPWFAKAIAIQPDTETAYRYWGDTLMAANQPAEARDKFIDGVLAQPYQRSSWSGLTQWCQRTHTAFAPPLVKRPVYVGDGSSFQVPEEFVTEDGTGRSAWLIYLKTRHRHRSPGRPDRPASTGPYRHSLAEEVDSLQLALADLKTKSIPAEKMDPSLRNLQLLMASHMLEPWVLLHGADQGIAEDYATYRATHREQLRQYILQFDLGAPAL